MSSRLAGNGDGSCAVTTSAHARVWQEADGRPYAADSGAAAGTQTAARGSARAERDSTLLAMSGAPRQDNAPLTTGALMPRCYYPNAGVVSPVAVPEISGLVCPDLQAAPGTDRSS